MINKILEIISTIINYFFFKEKRVKEKRQEIIKEHQDQVIFKSEIELIAKNAESNDAKTKQEAIEKMRKLIAEK